jgi:hypothetical protein
MSKQKQSFRRVSPNDVPRAQEQMPIDRLGGWLSRQPRLLRSFLAGFVAISLAGTIALLEYSYLLTVPPSNPLFSVMDDPNLLLINLIILTVLGIALYWIGWRLMIGFDLGNTPFHPGRSAAIWLVVGLLVFLTTACLTSFTIMDALR